MAFISGCNKIEVCPECGEELQWTLDKDLEHSTWAHSKNGMIMVNGYPSPCPYNGVNLIREQIKIINQPIIHTSGRDGVY